MSPILTRREVAEHYRVTERWVDQLRRDGKLPAFRLGSRVRFKREDVEAILVPRSPVFRR